MHPLSQQGYAPAVVTSVLDDALQHGSRVYGMVGLQGSGKSTLAKQMAALGALRGLSVVVLSIDDFYRTHRKRQQLGREVHPLLATRGPPGTHYVELACASIDALKAMQDGQIEVSPGSTRRKHELRPAQHSVPLPRFDKIADRRLPQSLWLRVERPPDLIVLEGWFLKVPAESDAALAEPLNPLERDEDPDGVWRQYVNHALATDYPPLWQRIDRLLYLCGPGFEVVPEWRWQQEMTLQATQPHRQAMDRDAVQRFVLFFERISRQAMRTLPKIADRTIVLDVGRQPIDSNPGPRSMRGRK